MTDKLYTEGAYKELQSKAYDLAVELINTKVAFREAVEALKMVEEWWLREGKHQFYGAPAAIFITRGILAKYQAVDNG